jgi:DNA invertase Pin-like site-specific DNA recombinase
MNRMGKAVIYLRVSTDQQAASGLGLEAQEAKCREHCARMGLEVLAVHSDPAIGGKDAIERRPGLQAVLALVQRNPEAIVVVYSLSRLSRRQSITWKLLDDRGEYRLRVQSASEPFDTSTPMGRAMLGMLAVWAALEADMIGERTAAALQARRERGHRLGATPLAADKPEVVARVRELYETGDFTHATLAAKLNELGLPTKHGKRWHKTTVQRTLQQQVAA